MPLKFQDSLLVDHSGNVFLISEDPNGEGEPLTVYDYNTIQKQREKAKDEHVKNQCKD